MFDIERVRASWQREAAAIDALVGAINDMTATEPIRNDGWTTQDLLGHIANTAHGFLMYIQRKATDTVDIDAFNEERRQRGREYPWTGTLSYWQRTRDEVTAFLAAVDSSSAEQAVNLPWLPQIKTTGDALRALIIHTRDHRAELERATPPAQA